MHMVTCLKGPPTGLGHPEWLCHGPMLSFLHHNRELDAVLEKCQKDGRLMEPWSHHVPSRLLVMEGDRRAHVCAEVEAKRSAWKDGE